MTALNRATRHYAQQAMTPGWWLHAQSAVQALESDRSHYGMFSGLRAAVGGAIQAAGHKPARHELSELWIEKNIRE